MAGREGGLCRLGGASGGHAPALQTWCPSTREKYFSSTPATVEGDRRPVPGVPRSRSQGT